MLPCSKTWGRTGEPPTPGRPAAESPPSSGLRQREVVGEEASGEEVKEGSGGGEREGSGGVADQRAGSEEEAEAPTTIKKIVLICVRKENTKLIY